MGTNTTLGVEGSGGARWSRRLCVALGWSALALGASTAAAQDRVRLTDGTAVEGRVVLEAKDRVVVRVGSKDRSVPNAQVAAIDSLARSLRELLDRWRGAPPNSPAALLDLAQFAKGRKLSGEARTFALLALARNREFEPAHVFLGHERKGANWSVPQKNGSLRYEAWIERSRDFSDGWRLESTHFALRSNLELEQACFALLELEFAYQAFFDWLGPELELQELLEPIHVQVHADKRSYPGGSGNAGFFDDESNTAFLDASTAFDPAALVHEATHGLLFNTAMRTRASLGSIPAWLNEGLAETLRFARDGALANPRYDFERRAAFYATIHSQAPKPLDLGRVLALSVEDFVFSSHIGLAYAQSYTLVQFCLRGDERAHRARFFEYLRSCYLGKSSATAFKAALQTNERDFERAWLAFVRAGG